MTVAVVATTVPESAFLRASRQKHPAWTTAPGTLTAPGAEAVFGYEKLETVLSITASHRFEMVRIAGRVYGDLSDAQFALLRDKWKADSANLSSSAAMAMLPAYQRIIGMGEPAVPLVLSQLQSEGDQPNQWFWALRALTGEDPVLPQDRGNVRAMAKAWIGWGRAKSYIR